ncbi:MAG: nicotinate phosphoribosyltransferase [Flammeovirgaceae bacterium]|nr:nicotinate phosphoribosyltransferase [Flammeovirgaceae bacterium]MDW8286849.1 nicotinate phosphoribosyltransferase [Flammeovirgaceae bacterium]
MKLTQDIYRTSLALLTDLYQITMAYGYWKTGNLKKEAVFHAYFRKNPFNGGFTIACGLDYLIDFLESFHFDESDIAYLRTLKGNDGKPLFEEDFLKYLQEMTFSCHIDAVPEGTVLFPHEPMVRVSGELFQCQLLESMLLNILNFQSLIATKAARVCLAADGDPVLEFGLRRAQGIDGALAASRASYIGGCVGTSNILAGKLFGIPVKGTHAHSWVMAFPTELEAFDAYANAMPNNCIFLVDTYNTLEGVKKAIQVGKELKKNGFKMAGIRLDSGDLAYLSIEARKLLDEAGFTDAQIVASNDLDEYIINSLKVEQDAKINIWGVGTKLVSAYDQPALGGVYKVGAIRNECGEWDYKIKLSEQTIKVSNPGIQQVRRYYHEGEAIADMIYNQETPVHGEATIIDPMDNTRRKRLSAQTPYKDLLIPIFRQGKLVYDRPSIHQIREFVQKELATLHRSIKRFSNPHSYPVGLEQSLYEMKQNLILKLRNQKTA